VTTSHRTISRGRDPARAVIVGPKLSLSNGTQVHVMTCCWRLGWESAQATCKLLGSGNRTAMRSGHIQYASTPKAIPLTPPTRRTALRKVDVRPCERDLVAISPRNNC